MRLLHSLLTLLPLASTLISASSSTPADLDPKHTQLLSKSTNGLIRVDDPTFEALVTGPRAYTSVILLTALDKRIGCDMCHLFQPDFELLAKSWWEKGPKEERHRLLFGSTDYSKAKGTFQKLGLTSAPVLYIFPPTVGPNAAPANAQPYKYDFLPTAKQGEHLARVISTQSGLPVQLHRPIDYTKYYLTAATILSILLTLKFALPYLLPVLLNRNLWAALTLIAIFLFTSGHMFNHIRKVPYMASDGRGGVSYIAGGFSNQYGAETQLVAVLYAGLTFCVIALGMKVPRMEGRGRQDVAVLVWSVVVWLGMGYLMTVFRVKNPAYPFYLPPLVK
ncbi:hypothetical protein BJ508DRAFT_415833 [Ascobolus immersus RN42]|uniref:Oligosaccharyl transferase subunit n=1 Tax=Ascobolus immersus RN42 TaxID=1160509 RepID=A0A3N4I2N5_ASCIM|nr:hypothetical protein BJ508DRAFT_415833 [Ascobolus immersus RN42]